MDTGRDPVMGETHHFHQGDQVKIEGGHANRVHKLAPAVMASQDIWNDRKAGHAVQHQGDPQPDADTLPSFVSI